MKTRNNIISFWVLCVCMLTACSLPNKDYTKIEEKETKDEESTVDLIQEKYSYEDILSGKISFETASGMMNIDDIEFMSDILYKYMDLDSDGEDELCIKGRTDLYVIKEYDGIFKEIYIGCGYENPVSTSEYQGIFYYRSGGAPDNQVYMFTEISSLGKAEETVYAAWYDINENGNMDDDDWYFLNENEEETVSKEEWLNVTDDYIDMKDMEIEWDVFKR